MSEINDMIVRDGDLGGAEMSGREDLAGLVARLRYLSFCLGEWKGELALKAADAIEALASENARLAASDPQCAVVKPGAIERAIWSAMIWAIDNPPARNERPEYTDRGNCDAEVEARRAAARILSAITLRPEAEVRAEAWAAALEAAANECDMHAQWIVKRGFQGVFPAEGCLETSGRNIRIGITPPADISAALDRIKAERDEAQAELVCAFEDAAKAIEELSQRPDTTWGTVKAHIRAMGDVGDRSALNRIKAEAKAEGMHEAAAICMEFSRQLSFQEEEAVKYCASAILAAIPEVRK